MALSTPYCAQVGQQPRAEQAPAIAMTHAGHVNALLLRPAATREWHAGLLLCRAGGSRER